VPIGAASLPLILIKLDMIIICNTAKVVPMNCRYQLFLYLLKSSFKLSAHNIKMVNITFLTMAAWVRSQFMSYGIRVDKMVLRHVFSEYFGFLCQFLCYRLLHIHHLSSGAGTIG
jgi:hypothetical protein